MANDAEKNKFIEEHRKLLGAYDELGQITLKGHLEIESTLNDILRTVFQREKFFKQTRLNFMQRVRLVQAMSDHEDEDFGWPLVMAFNALRNDIAHQGKGDNRAQLIKDLRGKLKAWGDEGFAKKVVTMRPVEWFRCVEPVVQNGGSCISALVA